MNTDTTGGHMARKPIRDDSNPQDDAKLPQRRNTKDQSFGDREIGSGGDRTTTDGRPVHGRDINDDKGWTTSR
jgi:hypothetical protein